MDGQRNGVRVRWTDGRREGGRVGQTQGRTLLK